MSTVQQQDYAGMTTPREGGAELVPDMLPAIRSPRPTPRTRLVRGDPDGVSPRSPVTRGGPLHEPLHVRACNRTLREPRDRDMKRVRPERTHPIRAREWKQSRQQSCGSVVSHCTPTRSACDSSPGSPQHAASRPDTSQDFWQHTPTRPCTSPDSSQNTPATARRPGSDTQPHLDHDQAQLILVIARFQVEVRLVHVTKE
jgi:hypothetical protein